MHAFIKYAKKTEFAPHKWDLDSYHGNYQTARSWQAVKTYCMKGGNFISSFDVEAASKKKTCGRDLNKRIIEEDLTDLVLEGEVHIKDFLRYKANKEAFLRELSRQKPLCNGYIPNDFGLILTMETGKQRHLWIWSSGPNKGKTTFLMQLKDKFPCYMYSFSEIYQSPTKDTQFVLMDEYTKAHLPLTQLNQMADGTWAYPVKGAPSVTLNSPTLVICSNRHPKDVYTNYFDLLLARFRVFELD